MTAIDINVTVKGPLFSKKITPLVEKVLVEETIKKIEERMFRKGIHGSGGQGIGVQRNIVTRGRTGLEIDVKTTLRWPRTTGRSKRDKDTRIVKAMAPRVMRKAMQRLVEELG